ncbi:hypothetical protein S7711_10854 [Stachybotrys chartarum IBT 7711]|uniref:Uncharacterized protein n=1 Tax=Stachybotrys chartarum (strain CBS 109288 / IBT 7711) TaxID=1280523 RepID=A0A084BA98_STACB|nr:hypothetical protein S7711_10854 [Stachybotrys chartarum IBT 7711]KFA47951.1 hypothetical protein S40293_11354 [Stachybotrys chartarum IBT 40293]
MQISQILAMVLPSAVVAQTAVATIYSEPGFEGESQVIETAGVCIQTTIPVISSYSLANRYTCTAFR